MRSIGWAFLVRPLQEIEAILGGGRIVNTWALFRETIRYKHTYIYINTSHREREREREREGGRVMEVHDSITVYIMKITAVTSCCKHELKLFIDLLYTQLTIH